MCRQLLFDVDSYFALLGTSYGCYVITELRQEDGYGQLPRLDAMYGWMAPNRSHLEQPALVA